MLSKSKITPFLLLNNLIVSSPDIKKALQEEIDKLLALNIIEHRTNTWASPIIPVEKQVHTRSGKHLSDPKAPARYRLCLDLRHVNASSIPYVAYINTIPDIINALGETQTQFSVKWIWKWHSSNNVWARNLNNIVVFFSMAIPISFVQWHKD